MYFTRSLGCGSFELKVFFRTHLLPLDERIYRRLLLLQLLAVLVLCGYLGTYVNAVSLRVSHLTAGIFRSCECLAQVPELVCLLTPITLRRVNPKSVIEGTTEVVYETDVGIYDCAHLLEIGGVLGGKVINVLGSLQDGFCHVVFVGLMLGSLAIWVVQVL